MILSIGFVGVLVVNSNNVAFGSDSTDIKADETAAVDQESSSVQDFLDNYFNSSITVNDASFSKTAMSYSNYEKVSYSKLINDNPAVKKYLLKNTDGTDFSDSFRDVKFQIGRVSYISAREGSAAIADQFGPSLLSDGLLVIAYDGNTGKQIAKKRIKVTVGPNKIVNLVGTAKNNDSTVPLLNDEGKITSRGVAPQTDWYTDKFMVDNDIGDIRYRVSTHEWLSNATIDSQGNSGIQLSDQRDSSNNEIKINNRKNKGEPLFKSNGEIWNFTLPDGSFWKVTAVAWDQYGIPYYQVSTDAWVRARY